MERRGWREGGRGRGRRQTIMQRRLTYIKKHDTKKKSNKQQYQSHTYDRSSPRTTLTTSTRSPSKIHPTGSQKSGVVVRPFPPSLPRLPPRPRAEGNGAGREQAQPRERTTSGRRAAGVERGRGDGGQYGPVNRSAVAAAWGVGVVAGRREEGGERGRAGGACWRGVLVV